MMSEDQFNKKLKEAEDNFYRGLGLEPRSKSPAGSHSCPFCSDYPCCMDNCADSTHADIGELMFYETCAQDIKGKTYDEMVRACERTIEEIIEESKKMYPDTAAPDKIKAQFYTAYFTIAQSLSSPDYQKFALYTMTQLQKIKSESK